MGCQLANSHRVLRGQGRPLPPFTQRNKERSAHGLGDLRIYYQMLPGLQATLPTWTVRMSITTKLQRSTKSEDRLTSRYDWTSTRRTPHYVLSVTSGIAGIVLISFQSKLFPTFSPARNGGRFEPFRPVIWLTFDLPARSTSVRWFSLTYPVGWCNLY